MALCKQTEGYFCLIRRKTDAAKEHEMLDIYCESFRNYKDIFIFVSVNPC